MEKEAVVETIIELLKSGTAVEMTATGFSMFPTLRPGDRAIIKPFDISRNILPGSVLVVRKDNNLVMHRLVNIIDEKSGSKWFITRGDSMQFQDPPFGNETIIGYVEYFKRNGRIIHIREQLPWPIMYYLNRYLIWAFANLFSIKQVAS
jgi:signal peptidase I